MIRTHYAWGLLVLGLLLGVPARAADHKVEPLTEAPPAGDINPALAAQLGGPAFRVIRGASRTVCDVWLCKEWTQGAPSAKPPGDVIYPFQPGQFMGVIRYPKKGADFRDQVVKDGVYTLRYGQQPVDGAHVGTSPTRDFFLLVAASDDTNPAPLDYKTLAKASAQAAGSNHPLLLSLQRPEAKGDEPLAMRHREEGDWWIVRVRGQNKVGDKVEPISIELVVVGKAGE